MQIGGEKMQIFKKLIIFLCLLKFAMFVLVKFWELAESKKYALFWPKKIQKEQKKTKKFGLRGPESIFFCPKKIPKKIWIVQIQKIKSGAAPHLEAVATQVDAEGQGAWAGDLANAQQRVALPDGTAR